MAFGRFSTRIDLTGVDRYKNCDNFLFAIKGTSANTSKTKFYKPITL